MGQWKKVAWSAESRFLLDQVDGWVHVHRSPWEEMAALKEYAANKLVPDTTGLFQTDC